MVISVLVFAFGFLVYHKMDMHQRKLTTSISPNGSPPPAGPKTTATVELLGQQPSAGANDPLVNLQDLREGSPFLNSDLAMVDLTTEFSSGTESFNSLSEPLPTESVVEIDEPAFAFEERESPGTVFTKQPTVVEVDPQSEVPDFDFNSAKDDLAFPEVIETPDALDNTSLSSATSQAPIPAFESTLESSVSSNSKLENALIDSNIAFDAVAESPSALSIQIVENTIEEPVLLAMAEPQQEPGFGDGFLIDDSEPTVKAPIVEPIDFPVSTPEPAKPKTSLTQLRSPESRGFNAVRNPGGRSGGNTFRTAAGSGSDGKFSLAAFNYQNGVSQSAPDDGSTFDSVVVQDGENYTKISKRVYGTIRYFSALAVFNQHRISDPKSMRSGMVVLVPKREFLEERYPELFADSQRKEIAPAEFLLLDDGSPAYRVGERETISEIAERFLGRSSRWIEIYRLNQSVLNDPNKLKAGLILALPADAAEVNVVP
ncbi:MAG: LysM domain-containing protein [Planctomycetota bacterium]|nr:LysM domain-containing protein [Planctomycetota bacterium]